jgi:hypothetical protein
MLAEKRWEHINFKLIIISTKRRFIKILMTPELQDLHLLKPPFEA